MSALVLDAGAFVAVDQGDRAMMARLRVAQRSGFELRSTGVVITQVWRDLTGRQAILARLLKSVDVKPSISGWDEPPASCSGGPPPATLSTPPSLPSRPPATAS